MTGSLTMSFHIHSVSNQLTKVLCLFLSTLLIHSSIAEPSEFKCTYPKKVWQSKNPSEADLNSQKIDTIARLLGGRGCIIRHGFVVKMYNLCGNIRRCRRIFTDSQARNARGNRRIGSKSLCVGGKGYSWPFKHFCGRIKS